MVAKKLVALLSAAGLVITPALAQNGAVPPLPQTERITDASALTGDDDRIGWIMAGLVGVSVIVVLLLIVTDDDDDDDDDAPGGGPPVSP